MTRLTRRGALFFPCCFSHRLLLFCTQESPKGVLGGGLVGRGVALSVLWIQRCYTGFGDISLPLGQPLWGGRPPSDPSLEREREGGREKIEAGRKGWLQQGLENGVNLEAFALFSLCVCVCVSTHVGTFQLPVYKQYLLISSDFYCYLHNCEIRRGEKCVLRQKTMRPYRC